MVGPTSCIQHTVQWKHTTFKTLLEQICSQPYNGHHLLKNAFLDLELKLGRKKLEMVSKQKPNLSIRSEYNQIWVCKWKFSNVQTTKVLVVISRSYIYVDTKPIQDPKNNFHSQVKQLPYTTCWAGCTSLEGMQIPCPVFSWGAYVNFFGLLH